MATEWMMVRVSRRTHDLLEIVRRSLILSHEQGRIEVRFDDRDRVSLDQVIETLAYERLAHQQRAREQSRRRRRAGGTSG